MGSKEEKYSGLEDERTKRVCSAKWEFEGWGMQKWMRDSKMTIYRSQKGIMAFNNWEARNPTNPHLSCHTCTASVHEPSDNNDGWTNCQMQHALWGRINEFLNLPISTCWASRIVITPWSPWFIPESRAWIKGGLMYESGISRPIWALSSNPTVWPIPPLGPGLRPR